MKKMIRSTVICGAMILASVFFAVGCSNTKTAPVHTENSYVEESKTDIVEVVEKENPEEKFSMMDKYTIDGDAYAYFETDQGFVYLHAVTPFEMEDGTVGAQSAEIISIDQNGDPVICGYISAQGFENYLKSDGEFFYTYDSYYVDRKPTDYDGPINNACITKYKLINGVLNIMEEFEVIPKSEDNTETKFRYVLNNQESYVESDERFVEMLSEYEKLNPIMFEKIGNGKLSSFSELQQKIKSYNP